MAENSKIQWTDHTFNPWIGCTKVSPGCANCYAEAQDKFRSWTPDGWGPGKPRKRTSASNWAKPLKWNRDAQKAEEFLPGQGRPRVFCSSLADWLDDEVPIEWLADLLQLICTTPNLDWLLLSKRPENWQARVDAAANALKGRREDQWPALCLCQWWLEGFPPKNVWIGTTVEDQKRADERIPKLLQIPAKVRFLSCEPLLEPVDLKLGWVTTIGTDYSTPDHCKIQVARDEQLHWVICGGGRVATRLVRCKSSGLRI